jgi:hypothetical protein
MRFKECTALAANLAELERECASMPEERTSAVILREMKAADCELAVLMGQGKYAGLNGSEPRCTYTYKR